MNRHAATGPASPRHTSSPGRSPRREVHFPTLIATSAPRRLPAIASPRRRRKKKIAPQSQTSAVSLKPGRPNNSLLQVVSEANSPGAGTGAAGTSIRDYDEVDGAVMTDDLAPASWELCSPPTSPTGVGLIDFPPPPPAGSSPRSRHHRSASSETGPLFEKRKDPLLHHRASAAHRQIIHEVRHQQRQDRLVAEQWRQHLRVMDASCILEEVGESEDEADGLDVGPPIPSARDVPNSAPHSPEYVSEPSNRREKALQRWNLIRDKLEEVHDERSKTPTHKGWNMFVKHVRAMSDMERARQDLYSRYGVFGRVGGASGNSSPLLRTFQKLDSSSGAGTRQSAGLRYIAEDETPRLHSVNL